VVVGPDARSRSSPVDTRDRAAVESAYAAAWTPSAADTRASTSRRACETKEARRPAARLLK